MLQNKRCSKCKEKFYCSQNAKNMTANFIKEMSSDKRRSEFIRNIYFGCL